MSDINSVPVEAKVQELEVQNKARRFKPSSIGKPRKDWHIKGFKNPYENMVAIAQGASKKTSTSIPRLLILGIMGGVYVGFGGLFALTVAGGVDPAWAARFPGIQKLLLAITFPSALIFIVLTGSELFTSNIMYMTVGLLSRQVPLLKAMIVLLSSFLTNYLGTVLAAVLTTYYADFLQSFPYKEYAFHLAEKKIMAPSFGVLILKAIPANMLVNIAVLQGSLAEDIAGKIIGLYIPISTFAAIGMEHVIANEFYVHVAMLSSGHIPYGLWLWKHLISVTIGNIIGGCLIGIIYWYAYLADDTLGPNHWITHWNCCCKKKTKHKKHKSRQTDLEEQDIGASKYAKAHKDGKP